MKFLIVVTTMFESNREYLARACIAHLAYQFKTGGYEGDIIVVGDDEPKFQKYEVPGCCKKIVTPKGPHSIGAKINAGIDFLTDHDFVIHFHDDMLVHEPRWLDTFVKEFNGIPNCGQLGLRPHCDKPVKGTSYAFERIWSDGVFFTSADNIQRFGKLDEAFLMDCEVQDLAYRMATNGKVNRVVTTVPFTHAEIPYSEKWQDVQGTMEAVMASRNRLRDRWSSVGVK